MHAMSLILAAALLAGCATTASVGRGAGEVGAGLGDAVSAPLEDLNVKRVAIPVVLTRAEAGAYAIEGMDHCEAVAAEIGSLNDALGPDLDAPSPDLSDAQKEADKGAKATLSAVHGAAESALPFHSWVRQLTGAESHRLEVEAAVRAGTARRAFLKARGMDMNCAPPAAPYAFHPRPAPSARVRD